jgi:GTP cyclohydrolase II
MDVSVRRAQQTTHTHNPPVHDTHQAGTATRLCRPATRTIVRVPVTTSGPSDWSDAELISFDGLCDELEHIAFRFGDPMGGGVSAGQTDSDEATDLDPPATQHREPAPVLVRIHSECLTGDVFGSARCDCGPQLTEAIKRISREGGVILYLRQEGRGIGLYNKIDAYELQDCGLDTFAANRELNFAEDERDYHVAAEMLRALEIRSVCLLTNNPDKAEQLRNNGIEVVSIEPTGVFLNGANLDYLQAKVDLGGHTIHLQKEQP